jgi:hypothetical protein
VSFIVDDKERGSHFSSGEDGGDKMAFGRFDPDIFTKERLNETTNWFFLTA